MIRAATFWQIAAFALTAAAVLALGRGVLRRLWEPPPVDGTSRRPFWRRKRWIAAAALWLSSLPLFYALSIGPTAYLIGRGWIPASVGLAPYMPVISTVNVSPEPYKGWAASYVEGLHALGRRHAERDRRPD